MSTCKSPSWLNLLWILNFWLLISGNNIYGHDLRDMLIKLQKEQGESLAAYILMQRIFPKASLTPLVRGGDCFEDLTISELGIYGAYLR